VQKRQSIQQCHFALLGPTSVIALHKMLMKSTTGRSKKGRRGPDDTDDHNGRRTAKKGKAEKVVEKSNRNRLVNNQLGESQNKNQGNQKYLFLMLYNVLLRIPASIYLVLI